ncbi:MAG TPA: endo-1,4-beta-xylanase [Sphingobacterium sp.]|nr:endo-1,4-beta-xylanase [Sphingobacterium sp.]
MNLRYRTSTYLLAAALLGNSCAKQITADFPVGKPESIIAQEDIDSYAPLLSYLDKEANADFRWGVAVNISDYLGKGVMHRLVNRNFEEIVTANAMKHFSIVQNDGSLNLANVRSLIELAAENNMRLYGHTLVWHAGQNAAYLNGLIAPVNVGGPSWDVVTAIDFETDDNANYLYTDNVEASFTADGQGANGQGRALKVTNSSVRTNDWDVQFFIRLDQPVAVGERYELSMDVRSNAAASYSSQAHRVPYEYIHYDFFGNISTTPTWTTYTREITVSEDMAGAAAIAFNLGLNATTYYFDNIKVSKFNEQGGGGPVGDRGYALTLTNPSVVNPWEAQTAYDFDAVDAGTAFTLSIAAKGSKAGSIGVDLQNSADYSGNSFGNISLSTDYQEYTFTLTSTGLRNRFIVNHGAYDGTVYIDDVRLTVAGGTKNLIANGNFENGMGGWIGWGNGSNRQLSADGEGYGGSGGGVIEKTPEEKEQIISQALETFIAGMMEVTKGHIKAWDVVNEPMSDWPDQYALKTGVGKENMAADEFYWQDYLGKDYAVKAIQYARQYGDPDDKLFINDYGLEGGGDKCKGLIAYVEYVESKGVTVDGIGTQMHIDINTDKDNIVRMYELLAATGKLIKVSELDIGLGNNTQTPNATAEQYAAQAEMYQFVIEKYFEIIPKAQQYGITIWSPLDSPNAEYSFWRRGEPVGLWTENLVRKPAYQAVAEALQKQK